MNYYLYRVVDGASVAEVERELKKKGLKETFIIEDDSIGEILIGGHSKKRVEIDRAFLVEEKEGAVDWREQWSLFAEDFREGKAHISLGSQTLLLTPGPGFGDLSHSTTYLMIEMLKNYASGASIVDVGTGSGILALAALLLGADSAIGIDIDEGALKHAKENAKLNHLKASFSKKLPKKLPKENVFLMNMIFPEQKEFKPEKLNSFAKLWIVSGILESQKEEYLIWAGERDWELIAEYQHLEWMGFVFVC